MPKEKTGVAIQFRENPLRAQVLDEAAHTSVLTEEEQRKLDKVAVEIAEFERRLGRPSRPSAERLMRFLNR